MLRQLLGRLRPKKTHEPHTRLGAVLLMMCAVSPEALQSAYECQQKNPGTRIGDILVEHGALSAEELEEALLLQRELRNGKPGIAMAKIAHKRLDRRPLAKAKAKAKLALV